MVTQIKRFVRRMAGNMQRMPVAEDVAIKLYLERGRVPWSAGYQPFKNRLIQQTLADKQLMEVFRAGGPLPEEYGPRLDERVIEFPWALAQLSRCGQRVLDAGSTLNHPVILEHEIITSRSLVVYTLAPETWQCVRENVSYIYGDLRETVLRDDCFDAVLCLSTLEHIGMDNTMLYTADQRFDECDLTAYLAAIREFRRVTRPGGTLLITVPFGRKENHGWQQQFERADIDAMHEAFGPSTLEARYYRYLASGWVLSNAQQCADCRYFNIHATPEIEADGAAAARAVACLKFVKQ